MRTQKISLYFLERILKSVFALFSTIIVSRKLSQLDFGEYVLYLTIFYFSLVIVQFGSDEFVIKKIVQGEGDSVLSRALKMRLINSLFVISLIFVCNFFEIITLDYLSLFVISFAVIFYSLSIREPLLKAKGDAIGLLKPTLFSGIFGVIFRLVLFFMEASVFHYLIILLIEWLIVVIFLRPNWNLMKFALKNTESLLNFYIKVLPLFFSAIAVIIFMRIDQFMIAEILTNEDLAVYSVGIKVVELFNIVPVVILTYYSSKIYDINSKLVIKKLYRIHMVIAISITVFLIVFSPVIIQVLFGDSYIDSVIVSRYYSLAIIPVFLGSVSSRYFISNDAERLGSLNVILSAVVNIVLNLIFIPNYGVIGAVWASVIAYYCVIGFNVFSSLGRRNMKLLFSK